MGDVYLAEDTKLGRKVALKLLPAELAESEERRARFQREAKALAALNHPNIITIHSVEQADDVHFLTMELVKGKTLAELIPKKGFPLDEFFAIAIPMADAVGAAHQEGITHRDLKPDNLMMGDDGHVKVLDFGLAKGAPGVAMEGSELPTQANIPPPPEGRTRRLRVRSRWLLPPPYSAGQHLPSDLAAAMCGGVHVDVPETVLEILYLILAQRSDAACLGAHRR